MKWYYSKWIFLASALLFAGYLIGRQFGFDNSDDISNHLSARILESQLIQESQTLNEFSEGDIVFCQPGENLQEKINQAAGKILILLPGLHLSYVANIPSNTTVYILEGAILKLADNANPPYRGAAVLQSYGTEKEPLENIKIIVNGVIDANKERHPFSKAGIEGIGWHWVKNSTIRGTGTIKNASGDGIDVDAVFGCYFGGLKLINNGGTGFHFGSPRPIRSSSRNVAVGLYAEGNGFERIRNGFDHSWPNINGIVYIGSTAKGNYRNWQIEGEGAMIIDSFSLKTEKTRERDDFYDASFVQLNGEIQVPASFETNKFKERAYLSVDQGLGNSGWERVKLEKEIFEIPISGYYFVSGNIVWEGSAENHYCLGIFRNEKLAVENCEFSYGKKFHQAIFNFLHFSEGDYVELKAKSKEAEAVIKDENNSTWMAAYLINKD